MKIVLFVLLSIFVIYRSVIHSMQTFHAGNKMGGIAILSVIPPVIIVTICILMFR
ncbi:hypothetical protein SAMN04487944_12065 [Gracilibacillus ureilyticus]|uniref:Uncharacterized protein n=1 Tax=Gracilibacillus ureilyticus TaxID=531814 RepID=A0A1H9V1B0_9BACI|nr:hypothetical protein SAMN04487944_12065 [Gracilibacillus ureilyticus]